MTREARALRPYLLLLRPANVVTTAADVLAGYAIAGMPESRALPWLLASSACLYGGGVVLNDWFDRDLDAVERPERPIPSGLVPAGRAARMGVGLLIGGVTLAAGAGAAAAATASAIAVTVLFYDAWAKRQRWVGPPTMGACRGLNLCLGMAASPAALSGQWLWALLPFAYIAAVTSVSRGEVHGGSRRVAAWCLAVVIGVVTFLAGMAAETWRTQALPLAVTALFAWRVLPAFWRAYRAPSALAIRGAVRTGVLSLVLLDAAVASLYADVGYALVVVAAGVTAFGLSRLFAVT